MRKFITCLMLTGLSNCIYAQNTSPLPPGDTKIGEHFYAGAGNGLWSSASSLYFNYSGAAQETYFWNLGGATGKPVLSILNSGRIGIGTPSPEANLHVVGDVRLSGNYNGTNNVQFSPAGGAGNTWELYPQTTGFGIFNRSNYSWPLTILNNDNIGIGTVNPQEKLSVNGKIRAKEVKVEATNWPDYVFAPDYILPDLKETEQFIQKNGRLPEIPSAKEVAENGIHLGEMNAKLLQKIEELTLLLIEQNKKLEKQGEMIKDLQNVFSVQKNQKITTN